MPDTFGSRLKHAWNAFRSRDPSGQNGPIPPQNIGISYGYRPDRIRLRGGADRSFIGSLYSRLAIDVASLDFRHVRTDQNGRYLEDISDGLGECLTIESNVDQTPRSLVMDICMSLFDEGVVALVPVDTTINPTVSASYDINTLRTGKILEWYPKHIRVQLYDENDSQKKEIVLPKKTVAIIENPLYSVMNEPNSTLKRLIERLSLLDIADADATSGKLDLIIQLPYVIKTEARQKQAEQRAESIEMQLRTSKRGIAYTDASEKITQLNRPVENTLLSTIEYLTKNLYSQLGLTEEVFNGTADEKTMLNYYSRTIEPIAASIVDEMKRKFLTKTARTQNQSIMYFRDPFKLVPISQLADIADKFTRNEILSSNEIRGIIHYKPSEDPRADELTNKNLPTEEPMLMAPEEEEPDVPPGQTPVSEIGVNQNGVE